jgi:nitrogen regulatory protein PII
MTPCKRIEIIIEEALARRLEDKLQALGAPGYTFIPRAGGAGDRGLMRGDDPTGAASNCIFIIVVEDDEVVRGIVEGVQPFLTRSGGVCLVSEALWLRH